MDYSAIIDRLEDEIRQYRIESQRFFNGDQPIPPEEAANQIRNRLNSLIGAPGMSPVDRFRLSALEGRYNSLLDLYRRRSIERFSAQRPASDARSGGPLAVEVGASSSSDDVRRLYDAIYERREKRIDLDAFHAYLVDRATEVRQRTGCEKVRFSVRAEDGKQRLKVRPA